MYLYEDKQRKIKAIMKYEDVIRNVGGCGRYQIIVLNLMYFATIFDGLQVGSMVFIVPEIKHR